MQGNQAAAVGSGYARGLGTRASALLRGECDHGLPAAEACPRWLKEIRSAVAVDDADSCAFDEVAASPSRGSPYGLTYARCYFSSPLSPEGPFVMAERALVDTGSSDCELHPRMLRCLPRLPVLARGAVCSRIADCRQTSRCRCNMRIAFRVECKSRRETGPQFSG
eukprot:TRINITY_DN45448_c0_g1_i1.p1 TRINITY_DN45448_c0_g1~~TRINITY_DN45448_c0_g1_i1.p1  ORF type:complete len:166 (-),score=11.84 TRINITY_DN45448_c0_g1_i1:23-520(-)